MTEPEHVPEHVKADLPELDRTNDPRGGAVVWALLVVGIVVAAGIYLAIRWVVGAW